jgi:hypothetical protein
MNIGERTRDRIQNSFGMFPNTLHSQIDTLNLIFNFLSAKKKMLQ